MKPSAQSPIKAGDSPPVREVPFIELLQVEPSESTPGFGRLEVTVGTRHLRDVAIMHGGMLATLLDSVMGMAAGSKAGTDQFVVTVQLNVNFIRPAWEGERLVATGEVLHSGVQTVVARGLVHTTQGDLVGSGSGTYFFLRHKDPRTLRFAQHTDNRMEKGEHAAQRPEETGLEHPV